MREVTVHNTEPLFIRLAKAATFLGLDESSLRKGLSGTLCLNEYRRKQGECVVLLWEQVRTHGDFVAIDGECDGRCKSVARRILSQAAIRIAA